MFIPYQESEPSADHQAFAVSCPAFKRRAIGWCTVPEGYPAAPCGVRHALFVHSAWHCPFNFREAGNVLRLVNQRLQVLPSNPVRFTKPELIKQALRLNCLSLRILRLLQLLLVLVTTTTASTATTTAATQQQQQLLLPVPPPLRQLLLLMTAATAPAACATAATSTSSTTTFFTATNTSLYPAATAAAAALCSSVSSSSSRRSSE